MGEFFGVFPAIPLVERTDKKIIAIDAEYVRQMVASIVKDQDLSRYIL